MLKSIRLIINFKTLIITIISIIATYVCLWFELLAEFPLTIIGIAVVFPIVFSISEAYRRREKVLGYYGNLKSHGRALFFSARDWFENTDVETQNKAKAVLTSIMDGCREMFHSPLSKFAKNEHSVYVGFSELSLYIKSLRAKGLPSGEASRANQYLSKMIDAFENMKHIYQYRTPRTLRAYSKVFVYATPILYSPYFAFLANADPFSPWLTYVMPILFSVIFVSLDNIQDQLENPFDQLGEDDVQINVEKFIERLDL